MKRIVKFSFIAAFDFIFCLSCSSVQEDDFELVRPDPQIIAFTASGINRYELDVQTDNADWNATVDQDWSKVEKSDNNFLLKTDSNFSLQNRNGTVSVTKDGVLVRLIKIEQKAAASGVIDPQINFWEDTHWRMHGLKGRVKTIRTIAVNQFPELIKFNLDGKITSYESLFLEEIASANYYEYDRFGRLAKDRWKYGAESSGTIEYVYGDHAKYVLASTRFSPLFISNNTLLKGIEKVKFIRDNGLIPDSEDNYMTEGNVTTITGDAYSRIIEYVGDFPKSYTVESDNQKWIYTYMYFTDGKFQKLGVNNLHSNYDDSYIFSSDSPYQTIIKSNINREVDYKYDRDWNLAESSSGDINKSVFNGYEFDEKGNWIRRLNNGVTEARQITYY